MAKEESKELRRQQSESQSQSQSQSQPKLQAEGFSPPPCLKVARAELNDMRRKHRRHASDALEASRAASSKKKRVDALQSVPLPARRSFPRDCLQILRLLEGNTCCVDCGGVGESNGAKEGHGSPPMWASVPHGTMLCDGCAFMHITRSENKKEYKPMSLVKHLENCNWNLPEIFSMLEGGNSKLLRHIVEQNKALKKRYAKDGAPSNFFELDGLSDTKKKTFDARYKGHTKALKKYRKILAKRASDAAAMFGIDDPHGPVDDNHEEVAEQSERAEVQMLRQQEASASSPAREARPPSPTTPKPLLEDFPTRPQDGVASGQKLDLVEDAGATPPTPAKVAAHPAPGPVPSSRGGVRGGQIAAAAVAGKGNDPSNRQMRTAKSAAPPSPTQTAAYATPGPAPSSPEGGTAGQTAAAACGGRGSDPSSRQMPTAASAALPSPKRTTAHAVHGQGPASSKDVAVEQNAAAATPQPQHHRTPSMVSVDASVASSVSMEQDIDSDGWSESGSIEGHPHALQPLSPVVSVPRPRRRQAAAIAAPASIADVDDISLCSMSISGRRASSSRPHARRSAASNPRRRRKAGGVGNAGRRPRSPSPSAKPFIPRAAAARGGRSYPASTAPPSVPLTPPPPEEDPDSGDDGGSSDDDDFCGEGPISMAALMQIASMKPSAIKKELETYGVSTEMFLEKSELVDALAQARADRRTKKSSAKDPAASLEANPTPSLPAHAVEKGFSNSLSSVASECDRDGKTREELIALESQKINDMKASEIRSQLRERGISTSALFEKPEFVRALAEARADDEIRQQHEDAQEEKEQGEKARRNSIHDEFTSMATPPEIASMKLVAIKRELEGYGVSTQVFLEKRELVDALAQARDNQGKKEKTREPTSESETALPKGNPAPSSLLSETTSMPFAASRSDGSEAKKRVSRGCNGCNKGDDDGDRKSLEELIACESHKIKGMSASEIRSQLRERGISTKMMFEKPEFVRALAEARVDEEILLQQQQKLDHRKGPQGKKERQELEEEHVKCRQAKDQGREEQQEKPHRSSEQSKSNEEIQKQQWRELRQRAQEGKQREKERQKLAQQHEKHQRTNSQKREEHWAKPQRSSEQSKSDREMQKQQGQERRQRAQEGKRREKERQKLEPEREMPRRSSAPSKAGESERRQSTMAHTSQQGERREKARQALDQQPQKPRRSSGPKALESERRQSTMTQTSQQREWREKGGHVPDQQPQKPRRSSEPSTLEQKVPASEQRRNSMSHAPQQPRPATRAERNAEKRRRSLELGIDACAGGNTGLYEGGMDDQSRTKTGIGGVPAQGEVEFCMSSMDGSPVQVDMRRLNPRRDDSVSAEHVQTRRPKQKERQRDSKKTPSSSRVSSSRSKEHYVRGGKGVGTGAATTKSERGQAGRSRSQKSTGGVPMQVEVEMCKNDVGDNPTQVDVKRLKRRDDRRVSAQQFQTRRPEQNDRRKDNKDEYLSSRSSSSRSAGHASGGGKDTPVTGNSKRMSVRRSMSEGSRTETSAGGMPSQPKSKAGWDESPIRVDSRRPKMLEDDRRTSTQQAHTRRPKQKSRRRDSNEESSSSRNSSSRACGSGNRENGDRAHSHGRKGLGTELCHEGEAPRPYRPVSSAASAPQRRRRTTSAAQQMVIDRDDVSSMPQRRRQKGELLPMNHEGEAWNAPPPTTIG